ncbi:5-formyltetrahydrofolate cyclo-ligase [Campylobacter geochelonis]|uniref:5-formyltetrahydrofolate cyclo-ligase n=1 Tax=Campylobacter geochelonis TaxID=1780362 RepID=A0A128EHD7_9BACT|nr:5-formyltetrahydrofolate cyclo-ligase [Campylobacter geochelonis]QKF71714.1 5-formyltetrahydrofolate cycloligase [Campylobacter geochelonis]CZE47673.1 5%2C10-methenyltetrahydrofolate synthetase [Campylobacter geochelonis]
MENLNKKDIFRKNAKKALKNELKFSAKSKHYTMLKTLEEVIKFTNSKRILLFMPLPYEPNLLTLRRKFTLKYQIYIPFMQNVSFKMVKLRAPFYSSHFGIKENKNQNEYKKRIDLAVIPVIGVDGKMARIGHGKGYYDIFFSKLKYKPIMVFVEIKDMFSKKILSQIHDIRGDFYITPTKNYISRGKYDRDYCRLRSRCSGSWRRVSVR